MKWCVVRYLHPADHITRKITKTGKDFAKKTWFERHKVPTELETSLKFKELWRILLSLVFLVVKTRKIFNICIKKKKKCCKEKRGFIIDREEGKRHYVLMNDFDRFMYGYRL